MEYIKQEINACRDNSTCLEKININLEDDMTRIPKRLTNSGDETVEVIAGLGDKAKDCPKEPYEDFKKKGTEIYSQVVACIKSKFEEVNFS